MPRTPPPRETAGRRRFAHEALARARTELGLTQEQAAAAVGVDVRTWRRYETGAVNEGGAFAVRNASRATLLARIARELGLTEPELLVPVSEAPPRGHVLQPARRFVGRATERRALDAWLADPRDPARVFAVVARGGEGKTALVAASVTPVAPRLVWSFYEQPDAGAMLNALCGKEMDRRSRPGRGGARRADPRALGGGRARWGGDAAVRRGRLPRAGGAHRPLAAEVPARGGDDDVRGEGAAHHAAPGGRPRGVGGGGVRTLTLGPLGVDDGVALLRGAGVRASASVLQGAVVEHGAHALSLTVLAAARPGPSLLRAGAGDDLDELRREDPQARRLARLLARVTDALDPVDRDLLARVAMFPRGASVDLLSSLAAQGGALAGALAGLSTHRLTRRLDRLATRGVVFAQRAAERYSAHPFVRDALRERGPARDVHAFARAQALARLDARPGVRGAERLDDLAALIEHTLGAGAVSDAATILLRTLGGFTRLGILAGEFALGLRLARSFSPVGDPCALHPSLSPALAEAIAYEWALFSSALGDLVTARRAMEHAHALALARGDGASAAVVRRGLAYTAHLAGDVTAARRWSEAAVAGAAAEGDRHGEARAWSVCAMALHAAGRRDEAGAAFARAEAMGDPPGARRALWRARWLLDGGDTAAARALATTTRDALTGMGWTGHAAEARCVVGAASLAAGALGEARSSWEAAREVAARSGEVELLLRAHALGARVLRAEGDAAGSDALDEEARSLREAHGFAALPP